ncbi:hypothetical protein [Aggregatibacter actinomycetemcomitans]|uniref:hypothetical protein n=1 Tax=Aggregatibacter actinomycetemcomitans TaxID=714 RepID=UPI00022AC73D|nr:hypothetical protein [Aggregatibacter actinomycetemcomitans]KYK72605.1 hypothetical protein SA2876_11845 [Aggregatibacter actinomycetemcomitans serotype e str. SA2876]MBN6062081.1 hypothetical protein [Aggregatibacter actinomycetemcomitans]MBN6072691.1 hypothetical protein [Aggregatibacter actinomycetemcomitans]UEL54123.1 hypothetical protein KO461_03795 [Aggregatibacter actinomycetemcomitans]BAS47544.1 hypothetical protein AANUM_0313 [Aggregatibacter actinomycetemcomitans NUM4039]
MQTENQIYAVNAELFYDNQPENVMILVYTANVDIAENHIRVYLQKHQICLHYSPSPPPS